MTDTPMRAPWGDIAPRLAAHLAFYSGWPTASTAITIARDAFAKAKQINPGKENFNANA